MDSKSAPTGTRKEEDAARLIHAVSNERKKKNSLEIINICLHVIFYNQTYPPLAFYIDHESTSVFSPAAAAPT